MPGNMEVRIRNCFAIQLIALLCIIFYTVGCSANAEAKHDIPDTTNLEYPFDTMSLDWGSEVLDGWRHYNIPESFAQSGGYFPDAVQVYTYELCMQNDLDYSVILALVEVSSGYQYDAVGSDGSLGYMQIPALKLACILSDEALSNPYFNMYVGINYFAKLCNSSDTVTEAIQGYFENADRSFVDEVVTASKRIQAELEAN